MKLFGKRQWILSIVGLICGLGLAGYVLKLKYGQVQIPVLIITGFIMIIMILLIRRYGNK
jgi:hypothetical protein